MNSAVHLTEDQIDDYLIGDLDGDCNTHLANCTECQARVQAMESPITSFRDVSLAWSERQSATMPVRSTGIKAQANHGHSVLWAASATAAVAICIAVPLAHHRGKAPAPVAHSTATQTFTAERELQIAQDNQMLRDIDRELGAPVSSPSEIFGLDVGADGRRSGHSASIRD